MSEQTEERQLTLGEKRVRRNFNPSASAAVEDLKSLQARFIDYLEAVKKNVLGEMPEAERGELVRLISLAQTHAEDAAMWAVKAVTSQGVTL